MEKFIINKRGYYVADCVSFLEKFDLVSDSEFVTLKTYNRIGGALKNLGFMKLSAAKKLHGDKWIRLAYKETLDGICTIIVEVR